MWLGAVTRTLAAVTVVGFCQTQIVRAVIQQKSNDIASKHEFIEVILRYNGGKHKRNAFFDMSDFFGISNETYNGERFENVDVIDSQIDTHRHGHRSSPEWLHNVLHKDSGVNGETSRGDETVISSDSESEATTQVEYHAVETHLVDHRDIEKDDLSRDYEENNNDKLENKDAFLDESVHKEILPPQNNSIIEFQNNQDKNRFQMSLLKCHDGNVHAKSWFDLLMCENRGLSWVIVNFILGLLLFSLGILSLYRLLSLRECTHILPRTHFVTIHLLIFVASTLKSVYLFHLTYGGEERLPLVLILLLNDTSLPCLFSVLSIKLLMVFNAVDLQVMNPKYSTIQNLSIIIVGNVLFSFISDIIVGTAYSKMLLIIARVTIIFMALMVSVLFMHKYSKITQISQLLRREFQGEMKLLVVPTDSPSRRQKSLKQILISRLHLWCQVILSTSWSLVVYSFCHLLNTIFLVTSFVPAWAWWIFHIISCLTEAHLALSILLAASLTQRYNEKQSLLSHFFVISLSSGKPVRKLNVNNDNSIYQRVSLSSITESTKYTSQYNEVETITPIVTNARSPSFRTPRSPRHRHATVRRSATFTGRVDRPTVSPYGHVRTPVPPVTRAGSASQIAIYSPGSVVYSTGNAIYSPCSEIYNRSNIYSPGSNVYSPGSVASMLVQEEGFIRIRTQTDCENTSIVNTPLPPPPPPQLHIPPPPPLPEQEILHFTQNDLSGTNQDRFNKPHRIMSDISQSPISEHEIYNPSQNSTLGIIRTPSEIYNHSKCSTSSKNSIYSGVQTSPKLYATRSELIKSSPKSMKTDKNLFVTKDKNIDLPVTPENKVTNNSPCNESNHSPSSIRESALASLHNAKKHSPSIHSISEINKTPPTPRNVLTTQDPVDESYKNQNGNLNLVQAPLRVGPAKPVKPVKRTHSAVGYNSVRNQIYAALPSTQKFGSLRLSQMRKRKQRKGMNSNTTKLINEYLDKRPRSRSIDEVNKYEKENIYDTSISNGQLDSDEKNNSNESLKKDVVSPTEEGEEEEEDFSYYKDDTDWAQELIKSSSLLAEFYSIKEAREKEMERYLAQAEDIKEEEE